MDKKGVIAVCRFTLYIIGTLNRRRRLRQDPLREDSVVVVVVAAAVVQLACSRHLQSGHQQAPRTPTCFVWPPSSSVSPPPVWTDPCRPVFPYIYVAYVRYNTMILYYGVHLTCHEWYT